MVDAYVAEGGNVYALEIGNVNVCAIHTLGATRHGFQSRFRGGLETIVRLKSKCSGSHTKHLQRPPENGKCH